jgi:hypothetical protein
MLRVLIQWFAQSLKKYKDLDIYLARFKEVVNRADDYVE